ncbi:conjugal transfer protein TraF [Agaribacterium sp. ZY112]|uniref:conjugal transfer protein TraF n=1 Tax=Agaribacterium sp. ZY112 TaxID=3233574 RepID=UPI003524D9EE
MKKSILASAILSAAFLSASHAYAASVETGMAPSTGLTYSGHTGANNLYNPASGALQRTQMKSSDAFDSSFNIEFGAEFGNIDELFDKIDQLSKSLTEGNGGDGGSNGGGNDGDGGNGGGSIAPDLPDIDIDNPELEALLTSVAANIATIAGVVGIVGSEGYTVVDGGFEIPVLINKDIWGGSLAFKFSSQVQVAAIGVAQPINFSKEQARATLQQLRDLDSSSGSTTYDLSGGAMLTVDPSAGRVSLKMNNDSTLLTKGARALQLRAAYSRMISESDKGRLYVGVEPAIVHLGRSNLATRIGDIKDSKELLEDISDADYVYNTGVTADLGVFWDADIYRLGAELSNLYEAEFEFDQNNSSSINDSGVQRQLNQERDFKLERQLRLEGSVFTPNRRWVASTSIDTNSTVDMMYKENQWFYLNGSYQPQNTWLPSVRLGYSENLVGSEIRMVGAGTTLFKYFNLDLSTSLDQVTIDDTSLPRGYDIKAGVKVSF